MEFPLLEEVLTASEESSHCQKKRDATAEKITLPLKSSSNCQSKSYDSYAKSDLDTMSLDDLYNHLKVYEYEVQKKSKSNSQNMAFISSAKHSSGNEKVNTASVSTASTNVSTASANIRAANISQDIAYDIEEMDIKWNMALLSMRADRFWKKTGKKITIQGTDVAGFDKSKVKCFNFHKTGHFARECRAPRSQDRGRIDNYRQGSKVEEQTPKDLMAIDEVGWGLSQVEARLAEHRNQKVKYCEKIRVLEFKVESRANCIESLTKELELIKKEKEGLDSKLAGFQIASKDLDSLLESQRLDKNKEGPSPAIESTSDDAQNRNPSVTETEASPSTISSKPFIKFVKATDKPTENKTDKGETVKKPVVKYAELYRKPSKSSSIKGNQRNRNNLKSQQLGVKMGRSSPKNNYTHRSMPLISVKLYMKEYQKKDKIGSKKGQKREAWRSREKSEAVTVDKGRITEENTKRRAENAKSTKVLLKKERNKGQICNYMKV
nr:hypothetical protein [Tanacetum cinerariifolium]